MGPLFAAAPRRVHPEACSGKKKVSQLLCLLWCHPVEMLLVIGVVLYQGWLNNVHRNAGLFEVMLTLFLRDFISSRHVLWKLFGSLQASLKMGFDLEAEKANSPGTPRKCPPKGRAKRQASYYLEKWRSISKMGEKLQPPSLNRITTKDPDVVQKERVQLFSWKPLK